MAHISMEVDGRKLNGLKRTFGLRGPRATKELINASLTLLKHAAKSIRKGRVIASVDEKRDAYSEISMKLFGKLRPRSRRRAGRR